MSTITASMVKELRETSGVGMMDCKKALQETDGDMEAAIDWLRKKGLSKAAKKADRVAAEGLVGIAGDTSRAAVVEVNAETDFVARNDTFQTMVLDVAGLALEADGDRAKLLAMDYPGAGHNVETHVTELVASIGENMSVRRTATMQANDGVIGTYVHNKVADNLGKIGVMVHVRSDGDKAKLADFARQLAMHIAAAAPLALTADDLDKDVIERERAVYTEQAKATGKPEAIIEKMVEGRLRKEFFQTAVLTQQTAMMPSFSDGNETVEQAAKAAEKEIGGAITIAAFERFALGEGVDKGESDFAAEVAAAAGGKG
ncbi:MAG: translation elongation factor Ts [Pseudomonadota bacterium]